MQETNCILLFTTLLIPLILLGCKKDSENIIDPGELDVNYSAAYVVNGQDASISIIDLSTNTLKNTVKLGNGIMWPHHININQQKTKLALGVPGSDLTGGHGGHGGSVSIGKVLIIDATSLSIVFTTQTPYRNHNSVFSSDGSEIWTALMDMDGMVLIYDVNTYTIKDSVQVGEMPAEVTFSSDGTMAFVANGGSDNVTIIDVATKEVMATLDVGMNPVGAWQGSNNKMYVDNEEGKSITVIDVALMQVEETVELGFTPGFAAYNSLLDELWITDDDGGKVVYYHRMDNKWMKEGDIITGSGAHAIAFSIDGKTAYITNQSSGTVSVLNGEAHTKIKDIVVGNKPNGIVLRYLP